MPLSLTCACGVRLEIDDKFAGQVIHCPDCHKALVTATPEPKARHTSVLAIASIGLALVGALTIVLPFIAAVLGWLGLRHIRRHADKLAGERFAHTGIALGVLLGLAGLAAYFSPNVAGIDGIFRDIAWRDKLDYPKDLRIEKDFAITRASTAWGMLRHQQAGPGELYDDLILVNPGQDAYLSCMSVDLVADREDADGHRQRGLQRFLDSELVHDIGRIAGKTPKLQPEIRTKTTLPSPQGVQIQEMLVDVKLAGYPRTFLVRVFKLDHQFKINVVAAGTRSHNFTSLEGELRQMLDSYKAER